MLVLSRKDGEIIKIGDDITIHVLKQYGKEVHIGINAPKIIPVYRGEIYRKMKAEREKEEN
jgi:carbon storage regulator